MRFVESINRSLHAMLAADERVYLIGEDLLDPYGGAFKVAKGLSTAFPDRVLSTPISESAIVGAATGLALRGMRPVVEIMFGDFLFLVADQLVNHATKFPWMYHEQVDVPLVIRTPVGGGRGYGPTHSQSPEAAFLGVPGLVIVAPSLCHEPGELLRGAVTAGRGVTLFLEHKRLYPQEIIPPGSDRHGEFSLRRLSPPDSAAPTMSFALVPDEPPDLILITYGGMLPLALEAAYLLFMEQEWKIEVIVPSQIRPVPVADIFPGVIRSGRALILEEGCLTGGWGAEVAALIHENLFRHLAGPVQRLAALDSPLPSGIEMEREILPTIGKLCQKIRAMLA